MAKNIDIGIVKNDFEFIKYNSLKMLGMAFLATIFSILYIFLIAKVTATIAKELRVKLFNKVQYFSTKNLSKFGISSLLTRTTNDITKFQESLGMILRISILAPITLVITIIQAYKIAPHMLSVLAVLIGILTIGIIIAVFLLLKKFSVLQKLTDKMNAILREILSGKRVIRAFNKQEYESQKFNDVNLDIKVVYNFINIIISLINPFAEFMINISVAVVVYFIAKFIPIYNTQIGVIFAFIQYSVMIMISFLMLTSILFVIPRAYVSFKRIDEVLSEKIEIVNDESKEKLERIESIEFKNVSFSYDKAESTVIENLSFEIKSNETLGIIGSIGSGKSTIAKLLLRFLDNTGGKILINGKEIKEYTLNSLRDRISYVPQISKLFNLSILKNVAYADSNPNIDRVNMAINYAKATDFADLDIELNEGAANLSGGQKQRIQIARGIYKDADLIIFDDSFSALDNRTDRQIRENLDKLDLMKIIISQKLLTIKNANKIIVLDDGIMVGFGTHDELIKNCEIYKEIYNIQVGDIDESI
ncbi:ABC transporter ATP-binding protein [Oceanivirga salmonicida]|uniref:ABC transporter ATP-binding protein n=1 Tax=Oceanivirga salmonicida TaxID=1769291 RepID=UPI0012E17617|nr:ABC transporter ATP-binding protein [Oceanivirga salmonicida]